MSYLLTIIYSPYDGKRFWCCWCYYIFASSIKVFGDMFMIDDMSECWADRLISCFYKIVWNWHNYVFFFCICFYGNSTLIIPVINLAISLPTGLQFIVYHLPFFFFKVSYHLRFSSARFELWFPKLTTSSSICK